MPVDQMIRKRAVASLPELARPEKQRCTYSRLQTTPTWIEQQTRELDCAVNQWVAEIAWWLYGGFMNQDRAVTSPRPVRSFRGRSNERWMAFAEGSGARGSLVAIEFRCALLNHGWRVGHRLSNALADDARRRPLGQEGNADLGRCTGRWLSARKCVRRIVSKSPWPLAQVIRKRAIAP
jgi:hypothetical protein